MTQPHHIRQWGKQEHPMRAQPVKQQERKRKQLPPHIRQWGKQEHPMRAHAVQQQERKRKHQQQHIRQKVKPPQQATYDGEYSR